MRVKYLATGQTGTIPDDKFDPNLFEQIADDAPSVTSPMQPQTQPQGQGIGGMRQITPEQLMIGRLTLDNKSYAAMQDLYNIQQSGLAQQREVEKTKKEEENRIGAVNTIETQLKGLEDLLVGPDSTVSTGRVGGRVEQLQSALGLDPSLREIRQRSVIAAPIIGKKILELDRLTDEDVQLAMSSLPNETDTPDEALQKLATLRGVLIDKYGDEAIKIMGDIDKQVNKQQGDTKSSGTSSSSGSKSKTPLATENEKSIFGQAVKSGLSSGLTAMAPGFNPQVAKFLEKIGLGSAANIPALGFEGVRAADTALAKAGDRETLIDPNMDNPYMSAEKADKLSAGGSTAVKQAVGEGLSGLSYAVPFGKGANALTKVLLPGAAAGAMTKASEIQDRDVSVKEIATSAVLGAGVGWAIDKTGKGISALGGKVKAKAPDFISQLFKPSAPKMAKFRKSTGGMNFADEVIKRDLKNIQGMDGNQIMQYYDDAVNTLSGSSDDFLRQQNKTVKKEVVLRMIDNEMANSSGRVLQGGSANQLQGLKDDIARIFPDEIGLDDINKIKREIQTQARAAYGPSGTSSPVSNTLDNVQRDLNKLLEKEAPGIRKLNRDIQYNRFARDLMRERLDRAASSESGGLVSRLLTGGGIGLGVGGAVATSNPLLLALGLAPSAINSVQKSPQFKTAAAQKALSVGETVIPQALQEILQLVGSKAGGKI